MMYENFINEISTIVIETRDEFIFQTISSCIVDNYQITVSKETLSKAVVLRGNNVFLVRKNVWDEQVKKRGMEYEY